MPAPPGTVRSARPGRLSNVVFMGMGEPLANYKRVLAAVKMITAPAPAGLGISARSVTVSTVGLVPAIEKLTAENMQVRLAVSLHTPDDELRDTLVPVNDRWKIDEVLRAARAYADTTGRRVSIEYALIRDINDQPWRADMLGELLREHLGQLVHVNLIPLNPTPGRSGTPRRNRCRTNSSAGFAPRVWPARSGTPVVRKSPPPVASWPRPKCKS